MKSFLSPWVTCALLGIGGPIFAADEGPIVEIRLNQEPKLKEGTIQTVRTKLVDFSFDQHSTTVFFYDRGDKVGVEILIAKKDGEARTDSSHMKAELFLKDGRTLARSVGPTFGAGNGGGYFDRLVAEFGPEIKSSDISRVIVSFDGHPQIFSLLHDVAAPNSAERIVLESHTNSLSTTNLSRISTLAKGETLILPIEETIDVGEDLRMSAEIHVFD